MLNRRGMSDTNLNRLVKNEDKDEKLSCFLPEFLVKKIEKDECSYKQSLFLEEENEEDDALEIKMDNFIFSKDTQQTLGSKKAGSAHFFKKSHSQKHMTGPFIEDKTELTTKVSPYYPKNRRPLNEENSQNLNPNIPKSFEKPFGRLNHSQVHSQQYYPYSDNFNSNLSMITNKLNNINVTYNNNHEYQEFPMNQPCFQGNSYQTSDAFYAFDQQQHNSFDSLNNSLISLEDNNNFYTIRPTPKKTQSEKNLKTVRNHQDLSIKSLFKEKDLSLEEINLNEIISNNNFDLADYIKTQKGSRTMQKELNSISPENLQGLLDRICSQLTGIMIDIYGNYFSQRLIQCCSPQQRLQILKGIMNDFIMISCHNSGTHSIQCMMEIINTTEEEDIIKYAVKNDILKLSYDCNGTHVMQKIIAIIDENNREYMNIVLLENLLKLVFDPNGICVIKKLINGNKNPDIRRRILWMIQNNCLEIIQNAFGNYIIQHILDEWGSHICKDITKMIQQNIISLSMQKFSSNVVEKCLDIVDPITRSLWIKDIFNFSKISSLLKNKYGNFVLQKAIMIMNPLEKREIKEYLIKKIGLISNKEKVRLKSLIEIIN